jgi:hypothetical protein
LQFLAVRNDWIGTDHYKTIYGEQILATPTGLWEIAAFTIPTIVLTMAAGGLAHFLYRLYRRKVELRQLSSQTTSGHQSSLSSDLISDESKHFASEFEQRHLGSEARVRQSAALLNVFSSSTLSMIDQTSWILSLLNR